MAGFQVGEKIHRNGFAHDDYAEFVVLEKINDRLYKLQAIGKNFANPEAAKSHMDSNNVIRWENHYRPEERGVSDTIRYNWFRGEVIYIANLSDVIGRFSWQPVELDANGNHDGRPCGWRPWDIFGGATADKPASVTHYR